MVAGAVAAVALISAACAGTPDLVDDPGTPTTVKPNVVAPTTTASPTVTTPSTVPSTTTPASVPTSFRASATVARTGDCALYPPDHFLNANHVDKLPVHPKSTAWTNYLGGSTTTVKVPSSAIWDGARAGIPLNVVDSNVIGKSSVKLNPIWTTRSYTGKYPIPENPRVQGYPSVQWDQHLLLLDTADCSAYELIGYEPRAFDLLGIHTALSGIRYPLDSSERPVMTTNAANTPMVGQYIRVDEVNAGRVAHVVGFCSDKIGNTDVWPAQSGDGTDPSADAIPTGAWLRLKTGVDRSQFSGQARPVVDALREHGMVLTDTCGHRLSIMGENSDGWVEQDMKQLRKLKPSDFEAIDPSSMMTADDSFVIR